MSSIFADATAVSPIFARVHKSLKVHPLLFGDGATRPSTLERKRRLLPEDAHLCFHPHLRPGFRYHGSRHFTCQNKADIQAEVFPDMTGAAIVIKQGVSFSLSFLLWVKLSISPNLERGLPLCPLFSVPRQAIQNETRPKQASACAATPADGALRAAFRLTVGHRAAWLNRSWLTGARRIYFWSNLCLKSRLFRPK